MHSFHQDLRYIQVILIFRKLDQAFSDEMSIFINILHFIQIPGSLFNIFKTVEWVCEKKNTLKKVPCKKYFETYFTNLHSFLNTIERADLRLELIIFHLHIKVMKNINATFEVREGRKIQESFLKYPRI